MFTLRFPFSLPPGQEIAVTEETAELNGLTCSLIKLADRDYVLTISGFPTEDSAKHYINNVWAGLMWMLLNRGLSPDIVLERQPLHRPIDGQRPAVYPTGEKPPIIKVYEATITSTAPAKDVFQFLSQGATFPGSDKVIDYEKLRLALELYGAYFSEFSANARFLTLVMALEALAIALPPTQLALDLLDKWIKETKELRRTVKPDSDDDVSLEAVLNELLFRRKKGYIRRQIRNLVVTTLQTNGDKDAEKMARRAVQIYDLRSRLIHDGKLETKALSKATSDVKTIIERVLRARFLQKATGGA